MDSKQWEKATSKENSQYQPSLPKAYTVAIEQLIKTALKQVNFKIRRSRNGSVSGGGSSTKLDMTCSKCGKKGHIKKYLRSKGNGFGRNPPKKSANKLQEWVTKKPVASDTTDLATATMTRNHKQYKWCTS